MALVGIFKTRFLKRLESSIEAFRESLRRAWSSRRPTTTICSTARSCRRGTFRR